MSKKIALLCFVLSVGACSTVIDGSHQDVKFVTPGAYDAVCSVYVDGLRYKVHPPQTLNLVNAKKNLHVDCMAPGNRRKEIYIEPKMAKSALWNMGTAGVGFAVDYASEALFKYPDVIEVNFTDAPVTDQPLPAQNNPDIRQPEDYPLEEFSPAQPRLNADRDASQTKILRRGEIPEVYGNDGGDDISGHVVLPLNDSSLVDALNPSSFPNNSDGDMGLPVPLLPGQ